MKKILQNPKRIKISPSKKNKGCKPIFNTIYYMIIIKDFKTCFNKNCLNKNYGSVPIDFICFAFALIFISYSPSTISKFKFKFVNSK